MENEEYVFDRVHSFLTDPRVEIGADYEPADELDALSDEVGWPLVIGQLAKILRDESHLSLWYEATACLFHIDCHKLDLPFSDDYLTALLYDCLRLHPNLGVAGLGRGGADNLVWSIVHQLKGVSYLSDYEPLADPKVLAQRIERPSATRRCSPRSSRRRGR